MKNPETELFDFAAEFAEFAGFIGAQELLKPVRKVMHKLSLLDPAPRKLFGTRYFFHEQIDVLTDGARPFHLDVTAPLAIRAATLIAGVNRGKSKLSKESQQRLRGMIIDNLSPDRDVRQLEQEFRAFIHLRQKFSEVLFADLQGLGNFDLLCSGPTGVEVECKTVSEDTGNPIKNEMVVNLSQIFLRSMRKAPPVSVSGIFHLKFKVDPGSAKAIQGDLKSALKQPFFQDFDGVEASIEFLPKPNWDDALKTLTPVALRNVILEDTIVHGRSHCITRASDTMLALVLETTKVSTLNERIIRVLKDGADQLSGTKPSMIWLHFVGFAETEFLDLARFSSDGGGGGLNALVANAISPSASIKDRSHVGLVRFSGESANAHRHSTMTDHGPVSSSSMGGPAYDVANPFSKYPLNVDL